MTVKKPAKVILPAEPPDYSKLERASNLPKPSQFRITTVPLDILIHWYFIHDQQPRAYVYSEVHTDDVMICSKSRADDEPLARYIENAT